MAVAGGSRCPGLGGYHGATLRTHGAQWRGHCAAAAEQPGRLGALRALEGGTLGMGRPMGRPKAAPGWNF